LQKIKGRSKSSKSVVLTGDMHIGHVYALASPLKKLRVVNDFWKSAPDKLKNGKPDVFIINGEPIDGDGYKDIGSQQHITDMGDQLEVANDYLEYFKMGCIGMTRGSNYHTTRGNTNFEKLFSKLITCAPILDYSPYGRWVSREAHKTKSLEPNASRNYNKSIDDILQFKIHDTVFNVIHHTSSSGSYTYVPTTIANPMLKNLILTGKLWDAKDAPTITVRSHTHTHVFVKYGRTCGFVTPAWQIFSRFMLQKGMSAATIGLVEVIIEPNNEYSVRDILLPDKDYPKIKCLEL
jgi:hypothetical protein